MSGSLLRRSMMRRLGRSGVAWGEQKFSWILESSTNPLTLLHVFFKFPPIIDDIKAKDCHCRCSRWQLKLSTESRFHQMLMCLWIELNKHLLAVRESPLKQALKGNRKLRWSVEVKPTHVVWMWHWLWIDFIWLFGGVWCILLGESLNLSVWAKWNRNDFWVDSRLQLVASSLV